MVEEADMEAEEEEIPLATTTPILATTTVATTPAPSLLLKSLVCTI